MPGIQLYPMGDRGGTATKPWVLVNQTDYTRWEIGGEPQQYCPRLGSSGDYTRWEIGGEPQQRFATNAAARIIPDGRSGGNRNRP